LQVIAIDEAQFFPDLREFCTKAANEDHKQVIVVGLNGDFRREKFGQVTHHPLSTLAMVYRMHILTFSATPRERATRLGRPMLP